MTTLTWDRHRGHAATYDVTAPGYNYRIDELRSAIGREQLRKLEAGNQHRRTLVRAYRQALAPLERHGWVIPFKSSVPDPALEQSACHLMTLVAPDPETRWRAAGALREAGIQTSLHYPAIPGFSGYTSLAPDGTPPLAREFCARTLTLPLYPGLDEAQVTQVAQVLLA